jgi:hypothetical protein
MCNNSNTLIDHILTNVKSTKFCSGSIIDDISDHWISFIQPNFSKSNKKGTHAPLKRD